MGFFKKLFGNKEEKPDVTADLPVQETELSGMALLKLSEILQPGFGASLNMRIEHSREALAEGLGAGDIVDAIRVQYRFGLGYVVFDEGLLRDSIGDGDLTEALNELFYVCLSEYGSITVKTIEGDSEAFAAGVRKQFDGACKDWGIRCRHLNVKSIAPAEADREFYNAYKEVWG